MVQFFVHCFSAALRGARGAAAPGPAVLGAAIGGVEQFYACI